MEGFKQKVSQPRSGMKKSVDPMNLKENEYTHARNVNISSMDGDNIDLTFEKSNVLSVVFPEGYKVIGRVNRLLNNFTYYFLTNPTTKNSLIGYVDNNVVYVDKSDQKNTDGSELQEKLEEVEQHPYREFKTLIDDSCVEEQKDKLNFDLDFPIKNPVLKEQKVGGATIYFTDNLNEPRYIEVDNISKYFTKEISCQTDQDLDCPLIYKLRLHNEYKMPQIDKVEVSLGGRLRKGTYMVMISLSDYLGNEISEYTSPTQPIDIWDVTSEEATNKSIKIRVSEIDSRYNYYKVVVVFTNKEHRETTLFDAGVFSANSREVIISDLSTFQRISLEKMSFVNQRVEKSKGMTSVSNSLVEYGLTFEKEINLQPVVNLMGSFLEWQTHIAKEDLYSYGDKRTQYTGINRNETVPYAIRFLRKGGTTTAKFPLVGRESKPSDNLEVSGKDVNRASYEFGQNCVESIRNKRWQYFNTAEVTYTNENIKGNIVVSTDKFQTCEDTNVYTIPKGGFSIPEDAVVNSVKSYIEEHYQDCDGGLEGTNICQALSAEYPNASCSTFFQGSCGAPQKHSTENYISNIQNGRTYYSYILAGYQPLPNEIISFDPYMRSGENYVPNSTIPNKTIYERFNNLVGNTNKLRASDTNTQNRYYENFSIVVCDQKDSLYTNGYTSALNYEGGLFEQRVIDNSQWFKTNLDIGKNVTITDSVSDTTTVIDGINFSNKYRVSFFDPINTQAIHSFVINSSQSTNFQVHISSEGLKITKGSNVKIVPNYNYDEVFFVVEQSFLKVDDTFCVKNPTMGAYQVREEEMQYVGRNISFDSITIGTRVTYKAVCDTTESTIASCEAVPYERGTFGYHQSIINYPDNPELYDSSRLIINVDRVPADLRKRFRETFYPNEPSSQKENKVKGSFNLTCQPIRHFRFPDNNISPFMTSDVSAPFGEAYIFPLGVTIDERVINTFLDVARDNGLITDSERKSIYGYEIFRGNLVSNRSVLSSGLLYDLRDYTENNRKVYYPNYPYNGYGVDELNQVAKGQYFGKRGDKFTYHSPDTDYTFETSEGSEISIQGYQFGQSRGYFDEVQDHPKWTVLSSKAYREASHLATIEVVGEAAIETAKAIAGIDSQWILILGGMGSTGSGNNIFGYGIQLAASIALGAVIGAEGFLYKYSRYKTEWLQTFSNMGRGQNFASYYYSIGDYNYFQKLYKAENTIRGIEVAKNVKDGRLNLTNRVTKEKYDINNIDREWSTMVVINKRYPIEYPAQYSNYDSGSLTYQSKENLSSSGRSDEIRKNIASPYVQIYNYLPSLHGDIKSISWITTSYVGDLENPSPNILPIYGGDTFISRHTLKRKIPLFLTNAMGQSESTAFEYSFYNNIGKKPKFYLDYNISDEVSKKGRPFPEIKSKYVLDNKRDEKFYVVKPSKFYLYYYGVPSFLTETRINTNTREYGSRVYEDFYPNVGDVGRWTQESVVSIREPNFYKYSSVYSSQAFPFNSRTLPNEFKKEVQDVIDDSVNGAIISLPDVDENGQADPWLKFLPLDFYEFDTKYGKLKELKGIENEAILARFENTSILFNKVNTTIDDGSKPTTWLGGKSLFQRRTTSFVNSELGYGGTQHSESLSCEYGHFHVDNMRGQVLQIPSGGGNMVDIAENSGGSPTFMKEWFKRNLPYKLLNSNVSGIENFNIDNSYNGVGMTFGYDSVHKRVFITKKDYLPISECKVGYDKEVGFYSNGCEGSTYKCPSGYMFNEDTLMCEKTETYPLCPEGTKYYPNKRVCVYNENVNNRYEGADVVFVTGYGDNNSSNTSLQKIREELVTFLQSNKLEGVYGKNLRFALIRVNNSKVRGNTKYNVYHEFTTNKNDLINTLQGSAYEPYSSELNYNLNGNWANPSEYTAFDLAVRAAIDNKKEITWQNEDKLSTKNIGKFRGRNIAKVIHLIGYTGQGTGVSIVGDGTGEEARPSASTNNLKGEYELYQQLKKEAENSGIEIYVSYNSEEDLSITYPSQLNGFRGSKNWFPHAIATTDCWHYTYNPQTSYLQQHLLDSVDSIGNRECRSIKPYDCKCEVIRDYCQCTDIVAPEVVDKKIPIELGDPKFFKDVSWTIAYYPSYGTFSSFYDFKPNYYVNNMNSFESGYNTDSSTSWTHNVTNKSFGVFQGKSFPMEVEVVAGASLSSYIGSIGLMTEAKRYFNNEDFYIDRNLTFNKSILYNRNECSGILHLDLIEGGTRYLSKYPITQDDKNQRIPLTKSEQLFNYNYFYNRVLKDINKPFILNDENEINIDVDNVSFFKKGQVERLNGTYFLNRLTFDKDSRFCLTIKLQKSLTNLDNL